MFSIGGGGRARNWHVRLCYGSVTLKRPTGQARRPADQQPQLASRIARSAPATTPSWLRSASQPRLLTPADATATEAVDNASVGTDLPIAPGVNYDPAAAAAAAAQAAAANAPVVVPVEKSAKPGAPLQSKADKRAAAKRKNGEAALWQDSTVIDVTKKVSSNDSGLVAVPVP